MCSCGLGHKQGAIGSDSLCSKSQSVQRSARARQLTVLAAGVLLEPCMHCTNCFISAKTFRAAVLEQAALTRPQSLAACSCCALVAVVLCFLDQVVTGELLKAAVCLSLQHAQGCPKGHPPSSLERSAVGLQRLELLRVHSGEQGDL